METGDKSILPQLTSGDIVYIPEEGAIERMKGRSISVIGAVNSPGSFTVEGEILHRRVHQRGKGKRPGKRQWRKVPVFSRRLGVVGYADMVEEIEGQFFPVEYKRGKARLHISDQVQLCLQAMCLEEMLRCPIETGFIYYASSRRRLEVDLTGPIRRLARKAVHEVRELLRQSAPPPAIFSPKCRGCAFSALLQAPAPVSYTHLTLPTKA